MSERKAPVTDDLIDKDRENTALSICLMDPTTFLPGTTCGYQAKYSECLT